LNRTTRVRENLEYTSEEYTISSYEYKSTHYQIKDINEWLIDNFKYLENSYNNCIKSYDIINYIVAEIGEYNYTLTYEVCWSIKDVYKLSIDLYSNKILLNYKGKNTELSEQKLKNFIQKNKKIILQAKENKHKKYIQRYNETREKERLEQLTKDLEEQHLISITDCNATYKDESNNKCESFIIKRTLKERYESQACKLLQLQYPWV
jgi:hypothetical protein